MGDAERAAGGGGTRGRAPVDHYWVEPGRLLAGEYPGASDDALAREKLTWLIEAGVTRIIDLTEEVERFGPLAAYAHLLGAEAQRLDRPVTHQRRPIPDMDVPSATDLAETLAEIDAALAAGETVYVHCWGGIGRTGTLVGCYLVERGHTGEAALRRLAELRAGSRKAGRPSPETEPQRRLVFDWPGRR